MICARHRWRLMAEQRCGCSGGWCTIPVFECVRCEIVDYGDNDEAHEIREQCKAERLERTAHGL